MQADPHRGSATLVPLFEPKSVALVGAGPDFSRYGGRVFHFLQAFGFQGAIWPVNPKYADIRGVPCFPSLKDVPGRPDHVGIAVAPERILASLRDCADLGVKAVTVFSSGFGETGKPENLALQDQLVDFVRAHGIRMLGPNCNGIINWQNRLSMGASATILEEKGRPGNIGIVSQSGGLGQVNVMWRALRAGLGISYQASCGNEADIDVIDVAEFLVDDPGTKVVLMAIEGIKSGDRLRLVAEKAARAGKPIVMLKLGRSEGGRRAAASHTGSMTGADEVHDAALTQMGVLRVDDAQHLVHAAMLFQQGRQLTAEGVASVAVSGGCLALLADQADRFGLRFPEYGPETQKILAGIVPSFLSVANPTDLSVEVLGQKDGLKRVLAAVADDPDVGILMPTITMTPKRDLDVYLAATRDSTKPAALIWSGGCSDAPWTETDHMLEGVPVYRDVDTGLRAAGLLVQHAAFLRQFAARESLQRPEGVDRDAARRFLSAAAPVLTERESKQLLAAYGLAVTREALAATLAEAVEHFRSLGGPVAMKIESPHIAHKSDSGGVRLGVISEAGVADAFVAIMAACAGAEPAARLNGVLVQQMVPPGVELILGCSSDPTYGPVIALGAGGIFAEFVGKPVLRLPPLAPDMARAMIDALPNRKMLDGVRGLPSADLARLVDTVVRFSWLVADLADVIGEVDINPLIAGPGGAVAADALVVRKMAA